MLKQKLYEFLKRNKNNHENNSGPNFIRFFLGAVIFIPSITMLVMVSITAFNEYKTLNLTLEEAISIDCTEINPQNEGKLIHISCTTYSDELIKDDVFPVELHAINITRKVEMYQWERSSSRRVTYNKRWRSYPISYNDFFHKNPPMTFRSESIYSNKIKAGNFRISSTHAEEFFNPSVYKKHKLNLHNFETPEGYKKVGNIYHTMENTESPELGDIWVEFSYIPSQEMSIIGKQKGESITPYETKYGNIAIAVNGNFTFEEISTSILESNKLILIVSTISGVIMSLIGLLLILPFIKISLSKIKEFLS